MTIKMTLNQIMKIRHSGGVCDNGGIWFNMKDFYKTTNSFGRKLNPDQWEKIEVIDEEN